MYKTHLLVSNLFLPFIFNGCLISHLCTLCKHTFTFDMPASLFCPSLPQLYVLLLSPHGLPWSVSPAVTSGWSVSIVFTHCGPRVTQYTASDYTPAVAHLSCCEMEQGWRDDTRYYGNSSYHCNNPLDILLVVLCRFIVVSQSI